MAVFISGLLLFVLNFQWYQAKPFTSLPVATVHNTSMLLQQKEVIKEIVFSSSTRGGAEKVRLTADSLIVEKTGLLGPHSQKRLITKEEWEKVTEGLQQLKLEEIAQLSPPTQLHTRDAAMHSQISIITSQQSYTSSTFDNYNPPKPLQTLMSAVKQIAGLKN